MTVTNEKLVTLPGREIVRETFQEIPGPVVTKEVPVYVAPTPAPAPPKTPASPAEKSFEESEGWKDAVIRGRILRPDGNGFVLMTDAGEQSFFPARIGAGGRIEPDPAVEDAVGPFINDLGYCRKMPAGTYICIAYMMAGNPDPAASRREADVMTHRSKGTRS